MQWSETFFETFMLTLAGVIPIVVIIIFFQLFVIRQSFPNFKRLVLGFIYGLTGLVLFLEGLELSLFPLGKLMASQLTDPVFILGGVDKIGTVLEWQDYKWVYLFAAAIGFTTTMAEPALIAVALESNRVSGGTINAWGLRVAVAVGVAVGVTLGVYRIVTGTPLHYYIITGYIVVIVQTFFAPRPIIPLAYDSGGVTTSTVTVPLVVALGLGLATTVPGRNVLMDGFGLIAFASLFPMITVMGYAQISVLFSKSNKNKG